MHKGVSVLLSLSCLLYAAHASGQEISPFDSLLTPEAPNTLSVPAAVAGTITFSGWTPANTVNWLNINYYNALDCNNAAFIGGASGGFTAFTPLNSLYYIDGTGMYNIAANYAFFNTGNATVVQSFLIRYINSDNFPAPGMSDTSGGTGKCYCYNVSVSGNTYVGSGAATGITYISNNSCSTS